MAMLTTNQNKASEPDYQCPTYVLQAQFWRLCQHIKAGTPAIRDNRITYLPKFENEDFNDYIARVNMTFANDHYAQTLSDHVGLMFARMPKLDDNVGEDLKALMENIDGEGTHWQVFLQRWADTALDYGHAGVLTDYPQVQQRPSKKQARERKLRPYCSIYTADNIINWKTASIGGVRVLVQVTLREDFEDDDGYFGTECYNQYRVLSQEVIRDEYGSAIQLGGITYEIYREMPKSNKSRALDITLIDAGDIKGPEMIPFRIMYGGPKLGILHSRPHLLQLAYSNLQETQLESDYAVIMHKCNLPTPIFIGRGSGGNSGSSKRKGAPIQLGVGIDIPVGGDAKFLEPSGAALAATRQRLEDIRQQMQRQGAFVQDKVTGKTMTATEAGVLMRQRNARLVTACRSLKDGSEGMISDIRSFMPGAKADGTIVFDFEFGAQFDTNFVDLCIKTYLANALPLDILLHVLQTGSLPDDFDAEDVALRMLVDAQNESTGQNPDGTGTTPAADGTGGSGDNVEADVTSGDGLQGGSKKKPSKGRKQSAASSSN